MGLWLALIEFYVHNVLSLITAAAKNCHRAMVVNVSESHLKVIFAPSMPANFSAGTRISKRLVAALIKIIWRWSIDKEVVNWSEWRLRNHDLLAVLESLLMNRETHVEIERYEKWYGQLKWHYGQLGSARRNSCWWSDYFGSLGNGRPWRGNRHLRLWNLTENLLNFIAQKIKGEFLLPFKKNLKAA